MSININDYFNKLSPEMQELVLKYMPIISDMIEVEIVAFAELLFEGKSLEARRFLADRMDIPELIFDIDDIKEDTAGANVENAANMAKQKEMAMGTILAILTMGISYGVAKLPLLLSGPQPGTPPEG